MRHFLAALCLAASGLLASGFASDALAVDDSFAPGLACPRAIGPSASGSRRNSGIANSPRRYGLAAIKLLNSNLAGAALPLVWDGGSAQLNLGRRLGFGFEGAAYSVSNSEDLSAALGLPAKRELVAKVPHGVGSPQPDEERFLRVAEGLLSHGPGGLVFWSGRLPVVPLFAGLPSPDGGRILIKPFVAGETLAQILSRVGLEGLTPEMSASLLAFSEFTEALRSASTSPGASRTFAWRRAFVPDLNFENLVWVDDPRTLAELGFPRPTFVLYELTARYLFENRRFNAAVAWLKARASTGPQNTAPRRAAPAFAFAPGA